MTRFLRLRSLNATSLQAMVRDLPLSALMPLAAAIFLLFTLLGPVTDMMGGARQPRDVVLRAARYLRVSTEMDLAHLIHQVLVPVIDVRLGDFAFFGLSKPTGEVGGDFRRRSGSAGRRA